MSRSQLTYIVPGQSLTPKRVHQYQVHVFTLVTDNWPTWISGKENVHVLRNYFMTSLHESYVSRMGFVHATLGLKSHCICDALPTALPGLAKQNLTLVLFENCVQRISLCYSLEQSTLKPLFKRTIHGGRLQQFWQDFVCVKLSWGGLTHYKTTVTINIVLLHRKL